MEATVATIILLTLSFIISIQISRSKELNSINVFKLMYLFLFCIVPMHVIASPNTYNPYSYHFTPSIYVTMAIALFYFSVVLSYRTLPKIKNGVEYTPKVINLSSLFMISIIVGVTSIIIYTFQFDSILTPILEARQIRGGGGIEAGQLVFFKRFIPISFISLLLVYTIYLKTGLTTRVRVFLILSIFVSVISLVILSGRRYVIDVLLVVIMIEYLRRNEIPIKLVSIISIIIIGVVLFGNAILWSIYLGPERILYEAQNIYLRGAYVDIINHFSRVYISAEAAVHQSHIGYRGFLDPIYALLALVPERVTGFSPPRSISNINTDVIKGGGGTVPPGIIAVAIYSGGMFGVFLYGVIFGSVYKFIDCMVFPKRDEVASHLFYSMTVLLFTYAALDSGPLIFVQGYITWILIIGLCVSYNIFVQYERIDSSTGIGRSRTD